MGKKNKDKKMMKRDGSSSTTAQDHDHADDRAAITIPRKKKKKREKNTDDNNTSNKKQKTKKKKRKHHMTTTMATSASAASAAEATQAQAQAQSSTRTARTTPTSRPSSKASSSQANLLLLNIGQRIEIWWSDDERYYKGTITSKKIKKDNKNRGSNIDEGRRGKQHEKKWLYDIEYDDGDEDKSIDLSQEKYRLVLTMDEDREKQGAVAGANKAGAIGAATTADDNEAAGDDDKTIRAGQRIEVYWPKENWYYKGTVMDARIINKRDGKKVYDRALHHHVMYDDGDEEWIDLAKRKHRLLLLGNSNDSSSSSSSCDNDDIDDNDTDIDQIKVGTRISIWWELYEEYYDGTVKRIRNNKTQYYVVYDDGDKRWENLIGSNRRKFKLIKKKSKKSHNKNNDNKAAPITATAHENTGKEPDGDGSSSTPIKKRRLEPAATKANGGNEEEEDDDDDGDGNNDEQELNLNNIDDGDDSSLEDDDDDLDQEDDKASPIKKRRRKMRLKAFSTVEDDAEDEEEKEEDNKGGDKNTITIGAAISIEQEESGLGHQVHSHQGVLPQQEQQQQQQQHHQNRRGADYHQVYPESSSACEYNTEEQPQPPPQQQQQQQCPICMADQMKNPTSLDCCHLFCKGCIKSELFCNKSSFCPVCQFPLAPPQQQPEAGVDVVKIRLHNRKKFPDAFRDVQMINISNGRVIETFQSASAASMKLGSGGAGSRSPSCGIGRDHPTGGATAHRHRDSYSALNIVNACRSKTKKGNKYQGFYWKFL